MTRYRIMIRTAAGNKDQYQFLTFTNVNGEEEIWETTSLVELDKQVEKMLNGNFRKCDIQLVSPLDFTVFADVYDNDKYPPEPEPEPTPEPEPEPTVSITDITREVNKGQTEDEPPVEYVESVVFTAVGENLPAEESYNWTFTVGVNTVNKTSVGPVLTVTDEDKDSLAGAVGAVVTVGETASPMIDFE